MRILLADDQSEVRLGLRVLLEQEHGLSVVGETAEYSDLLTKAESIRPDILLLDWELSNKKTSGLIPILRSLCPGLLIIALSGRPESKRAALKAGVDAFVSKGDQPEILLETINNFYNKGDKDENNSRKNGL